MSYKDRTIIDSETLKRMQNNKDQKKSMLSAIIGNPTDAVDIIKSRTVDKVANKAKDISGKLNIGFPNVDNNGLMQKEMTPYMNDDALIQGNNIGANPVSAGYYPQNQPQNTGITGMIPNPIDMVTMDQSKPGSALDFFLQSNPYTGVPFTVMRNLKAMEDPEKYGAGTTYGTLFGYGKGANKKMGLFDYMSNIFGGTPAPTTVPMGVSPYTQGNPLDNGGSASSGAPGSQNTGFGSYGGWGSEASATQGAYDEMSEDGFY